LEQQQQQQKKQKQKQKPSSSLQVDNKALRKSLQVAGGGMHGK